MTLVRTAAEMRNNFEDIKKFIAEQDEIIMDEAEKQHEHTQKVIGGPRPQPAASARFQRSMGEAEDDMPTKRRNVFKRALKGLGSKNSAELQNIEGMLMQLLDDVDGLRSLQEGRPPISATTEQRSTSLASAENARTATDPGYEPEGQAGTSSTGDRSGFFSNNSSRQADYRGAAGRHESNNRVSTVMEGDEEYDDYDEATANHERDIRRTPRASPSQDIRGSSVPLATPPRMHDTMSGALSNDHTPRQSTEGTASRKHKSITSSFFPKMISRWSKTTASSGGDNYRSSTQTKPRPYSQVSHSGSHLDDYPYDAQGDDRLRSNTSLQDEQYGDEQENRPPSPLIPSQVSSEHPKYQAHRDSLNLQHPQPRQGPTGRYQSHLESEAQNYPIDQTSPTSQTSSQWENQNTLNAVDNRQVPYQHGGHLSPISDGGYSQTSTAMNRENRAPSAISAASSRQSSRQGPARPPKILDDEPLVPQRPPKVPMSPNSGRQASYIDHVAAARAGSPAFDKVRPAHRPS